MSCSCPDHSLPRPGSFRFRRGVNRREVLKLALGSAGIAALGPVAARRLPVASGAPLGNKIFVLVYLDGGCDTLNAVIPSTLSSYFSLRPTIQIPDASSLALTGGPGTSLYRLHPSMPTIRDLWNDGDVALVQKVGYPNENLSHFESQDIYAHAVRGEFAPLGIEESGWIARYAQLYAPTPMGAVSIGQGRPTAFVGGSSNPLQVGSLSSFNFARDNRYPDNHAYRLQVVQNVLNSATTVGTPGEVRAAIDQAADLTGQIQTALAAYNTYLAGSGVTYVDRSISRSLRDVAALVHGGFETRVFYTGYGGFDTHGGQGAATGWQADLFADLDAGIASFSADMKNLNQWDNVVIGVYTEFGRRNDENGSEGTDHGAGYAMMLVGGGVSGGTYGPDLTNADLSPEYLDYAVDFRDVWKEVIADHLGANPTPVFPEAQPTNVTLGVV
jgi:uncharacterized protein (DUF1501 family)